MKAERFPATVAGLALAGLCLVWIEGCEDQPTKSGQPHTPKDYAVYCADLSAPVAYSYKVVSGILDTINLPFVAERGLAISPDGGTIYAAGQSGVVLVDVATENSTSFWTGFPTYGITLSPNGKYLAIHGADLAIVDLETMSVKHSDTDATFLGTFSADSRRFLAPTADAGQIYEVSLEGSGEVSRTLFPGRGYRSIRVSRDGSKWFLYEAEECAGRFEVLDRIGDSLLFSHRDVPGNGRITVSPDGLWASYTNPGMIEDFCWDDPAYGIRLYSVPGNRLEADISTKVTLGGVSDSAVIVDAVVTPDNKWLVGMSWRGEFVTVDLSKRKIVRFLRVATPRRPTEFLSCQSFT